MPPCPLFFVGVVWLEGVTESDGYLFGFALCAGIVMLGVAAALSVGRLAPGPFAETASGTALVGCVLVAGGVACLVGWPVPPWPVALAALAAMVVGMAIEIRARMRRARHRRDVRRGGMRGERTDMQRQP